MAVNQQMTAQQVQAAQAQAQAQALQAAVGAQGNAQRNPFWNVQGLPGGPGPMMNQGFPGNFYPQMQAAAMVQDNTAMVAIAKLGPSKNNPDANSSLVVRNSVRKFNVNGTPLSVAQWTRKCVEENLEWLIKLAKRHFPNEKTILLAYGDGCETLVLLDEHANKMPSDFRLIKKIGVGVSMAPSDEKSHESKLATFGILQPSDSIWEHLRFEQVNTNGDKTEKSLFIHTCITVWSDSIEARRRIIQAKTGAPDKPYKAVTYMPNPMFEQQVLAQWKTQGSSGQTSLGEVEGETLITFNPKELILLEKAFDNLMTAKDSKIDAVNYTEEDKRLCQRVIKRAHAEFVMRGPPRKRTKKADKEKEAEVKQETPKAPETKASPSPTKKGKAKKAAVKKNEDEEESDKENVKEKKTEVKDEDSDDEPISKLKPTPAKKKGRNSTASKKAAPAKAKAAAKETKTENKRTTRGKAANKDAEPKKATKKSKRKSSS